MALRLLPPRSRLGWTPYGWLVYLSAYVLFIWAQKPPAGSMALQIAALPVFLVLYFRGYWVKGRELLLIVAAIVLLGVLLVPVNPGAMSFFIYAAAFLSGVGPPGTAFRWMAVLVGIVLAEAWIVQLSPFIWGVTIVLSVIVGSTNIHFVERDRADSKLRLAHEEIERLAKVEERERIARDLHDLLGHTLSVIVLKSELASRLAERDPAKAMAEIRDVERISREALAEVRRAVQGYRVTRFREELAGARLALETTGVELIADVAPLDLSRCDEPALAMTLREAITNVLRHARARRCWVTLRESAGRVVLEVRDDGVGGEIVEGTGMTGMRARLAEAGGGLTRDGTSGTRLVASVPYPASAVERGPARGAAS